MRPETMGSSVSVVLDKAEESGFDRGNALHIAAASIPVAVVLGVSTAAMENFVFRPVGFRLAGLKDVPGAPAVIAVKFQTWCSSFIGHSVMAGLWVKYLKETNSVEWVFDYKNWDKALFFRLNDVEGRRAVGPYYLMYFSYLWNTCYKDMIKSASRKGGAQQAIFDLHHVLTIGLISSSIWSGTWRAGVLTRVIHDYGDIVLYSTMLRRSMYDTRGGHPSVMYPWFVANNVVWPFTRIIMYGHACFSLLKMLRKFKAEGEKGDPELRARVPWYTAQLAGSFAMLALQFAFYKGLIDATLDFRRTGGKIIDPFHGDAFKNKAA